MKHNSGLSGLKHFYLYQVYALALLCLGFLFFGSVKKAVSAALGGGVAMIPSIVFARKLFQYQGARARKQIVKSFYMGEALKLALTIILFALVFGLTEVAPLTFFLTYIAVLMSHWFAPLFMNKQNRLESD